MYEITVDDLKNINNDNTVIIDIRDETAHNHGYIQGAVSMPEKDEKYFSALNADENKTVIVYCGIGERSESITEILRSKGIKANVVNLIIAQKNIKKFMIYAN